MHTNLMCDLETFGKRPDAMVVAIGAVTFSKEGLGQTFYRIIDPERATGSVDTSTIKWWLQQSDNARSIFKSGADSISELLALMEFQVYCQNICNRDDLKFWGNGATFDNVILRSAYERNRLQTPWIYWNDRCYRTYKSIYSKIKTDHKGTKHNALDDAIAQAEHMVKILKER